MRHTHFFSKTRAITVWIVCGKVTTDVVFFFGNTQADEIFEICTKKKYDEYKSVSNAACINKRSFCESI